MLTDGSALVGLTDQGGVESSTHKRTRSDISIKPPAAASGKGLHKRSRPAKTGVKDIANTNTNNRDAIEGPVSARQDTANTDSSHAAEGSALIHQDAVEGSVSAHQVTANIDNALPSNTVPLMPYTSHWGTKQSSDYSHYGMVDPSQSSMLGTSHYGMFDTSQYAMLGPSQYSMLDTSQSSMLDFSQYGMLDPL